MAFKITAFNESIRTIILVVIALPLISTSNIDCNGKTFHCVNSTHFMICVDLGGGVSSTIDNFVIPCPPSTECQGSNQFECEFPRSTTLTPLTDTSVQSEVLNVTETSLFATDGGISDAQSMDLTFNTVSITTVQDTGTSNNINTESVIEGKSDTTNYTNIMYTTTEVPNELRFNDKTTTVTEAGFMSTTVDGITSNTQPTEDIDMMGITVLLQDTFASTTQSVTIENTEPTDGIISNVQSTEKTNTASVNPLHEDFVHLTTNSIIADNTATIDYINLGNSPTTSLNEQGLSDIVTVTGAGVISPNADAIISTVQSTENANTVSVTTSQQDSVASTIESVTIENTAVTDYTNLRMAPTESPNKLGLIDITTVTESEVISTAAEGIISTVQPTEDTNTIQFTTLQDTVASVTESGILENTETIDYTNIGNLFTTWPNELGLSDLRTVTEAGIISLNADGIVSDMRSTDTVGVTTLQEGTITFITPVTESVMTGKSATTDFRTIKNTIRTQPNVFRQSDTMTVTDAGIMFTNSDGIFSEIQATDTYAVQQGNTVTSITQITETVTGGNIATPDTLPNEFGLSDITTSTKAGIYVTDANGIVNDVQSTDINAVSLTTLLENSTTHFNSVTESVIEENSATIDSTNLVNDWTALPYDLSFSDVTTDTEAGIISTTVNGVISDVESTDINVIGVNTLKENAATSIKPAVESVTLQSTSTATMNELRQSEITTVTEPSTIPITTNVAVSSNKLVIETVTEKNTANSENINIRYISTAAPKKLSQIEIATVTETSNVSAYDITSDILLAENKTNYVSTTLEDTGTSNKLVTESVIVENSPAIGYTSTTVPGVLSEIKAGIVNAIMPTDNQIVQTETNINTFYEGNVEANTSVLVNDSMNSFTEPLTLENTVSTTEIPNIQFILATSNVIDKPTVGYAKPVTSTPIYKGTDTVIVNRVIDINNLNILEYNAVTDKPFSQYSATITLNEGVLDQTAIEIATVSELPNTSATTTELVIGKIIESNDNENKLPGFAQINTLDEHVPINIAPPSSANTSGTFTDVTEIDNKSTNHLLATTSNINMDVSKTDFNNQENTVTTQQELKKTEITRDDIVINTPSVNDKINGANVEKPESKIFTVNTFGATEHSLKTSIEWPASSVHLNEPSVEKGLIKTAITETLPSDLQLVTDNVIISTKEFRSTSEISHTEPYVIKPIFPSYKDNTRKQVETERVLDKTAPNLSPVTQDTNIVINNVAGDMFLAPFPNEATFPDSIKNTYSEVLPQNKIDLLQSSKQNSNQNYDFVSNDYSKASITSDTDIIHNSNNSSDQLQNHATYLERTGDSENLTVTESVNIIEILNVNTVPRDGIDDASYQRKESSIIDGQSFEGQSVMDENLKTVDKMYIKAISSKENTSDSDNKTETISKSIKEDVNPSLQLNNNNESISVIISNQQLANRNENLENVNESSSHSKSLDIQKDLLSSAGHDTYGNNRNEDNKNLPITVDDHNESILDTSKNNNVIVKNKDLVEQKVQNISTENSGSSSTDHLLAITQNKESPGGRFSNQSNMTSITNTFVINETNIMSNKDSISLNETDTLRFNYASMTRETIPGRNTSFDKTHTPSMPTDVRLGQSLKLGQKFNGNTEANINTTTGNIQNLNNVAKTTVILINDTTLDKKFLQNVNQSERKPNKKNDNAHVTINNMEKSSVNTIKEQEAFNYQQRNIATQKTVEVTTVMSKESTVISPIQNIHEITSFCFNRNRGRYADSEDCTKFYICIGRAEPIVGRCPTNTVFSEAKKQCTKNKSHCVRGSEFQCLSEGRFSDILKNNAYFICVKRQNSFIRFKFQCQNGYYLNKKTVRCTKQLETIGTYISVDNSNSEKSVSEGSKESNKSKKDKESKKESKSSEEFECKKEGKFADPDNCGKFYVCTKTKKSEFRMRRKSCDSDEVFHKDKKKCVDADSYEC